MVYSPSSLPPLSNINRGTIDPTQFGRTGSAYTNPDFLKLYMAQLDKQAFDTLYGDEGLNNSIFGDTNSVFNTVPSSTDPLFGGSGGSASLPSDIGGATTSSSGSQYLELIARSNLVGKMAEAINPSTNKTFSGKINSVSVENGILLIDVGGVKITPEYLVKITQ